MKNGMITILAICVLLAGAWLAYTDETRIGENTISGPFTHQNLSVFFIHGENSVGVENTLTLEEALKDKLVVVYETGDVGELQIENKANRPVYINSGDIVKGGRQDRIIRYDVVIRPKSGKEKLPSFCVESGRWSQRGAEDATQFELSDKMAVSKELKLSAKSIESQERVWSEVSAMQMKLSDAANISVQAGRSASSLQLTLEHDAVDSLIKEFVNFFISKADRYEDIVGFAFAINGKINSADIYRSHKLFLKLWPKLIEAASVEAVSNPDNSGDPVEVTLDEIISWLESADGSDSESKEVNKITNLIIKEAGSDIVFETIEKEDNTIIHKNIIKR